MATIFTRIINGELPSHQVYADEVCVVFLSIDPLTDGHALVVPRQEEAHWVDLPSEIWGHCLQVAQKIASAQEQTFLCKRVGVLVEGYEVPHVHIHVWPTTSPKNFRMDTIIAGQDQSILQQNAEMLRATLRTQGLGKFVPEGTSA